MVSGHDRRVTPLSLQAPEKHIPALRPWHQVDEHINDVGKIICVIRVDSQEHRLQESWEQAVEELPLLPFGVVQQRGPRRDGGQAEGDPIIVDGELFTSSHTALLDLNVPIKALYGVMLETILVLFQVGRDFTNIVKSQPEATNETGGTWAVIIDELQDHPFLSKEAFIEETAFNL